MALLATVSAHDLGFIDLDEMVARIEATLTTVEGLERFEGHLLNWYDTDTLVPLQPAYVSTVDSGNLAGALVTLASSLPRLAASRADLGRDRRASARPGGAGRRAVRRDELQAALRRAPSVVRHRLSARRRGMGLAASIRGKYDLLASEARLASFLAISKGDVPESHWFHLGRAVTAVRGAPVLLSWSATLFEYLMPLLLTRTYPGTLLDESCRMAVRRQIDYGARLGVPWGMSESAYSAVDRHGTYQYKAFGVPGIGPEARVWATNWSWRRTPARWRRCWFRRRARRT